LCEVTKFCSSAVLFCCVIALSGCSTPNNYSEHEHKDLTLTSFRSTSGKVSDSKRSEERRAVSQHSLQTSIVGDQKQIAETNANIADIRQSLIERESSLESVVLAVGYDVPSDVRYISSATITAAKIAAKTWVENRERELEHCQNRARNIEPSARRTSDIYVTDRYSEIDRGVAHRNQTRERIGARPAGQAEAQARARKQLQARLTGQSLYGQNIRIAMTANRDQQNKLRAEIVSAKRYVQVLNQYPTEILKLDSELASAEQKLNGLRVAIGNNTLKLQEIRRAAALIRQRERDRAAQRPSETTFVSNTGNAKLRSGSDSIGGSGLTTRHRSNSDHGRYSKSGDSNHSRRYDYDYRPSVDSHYVKPHTRRDGTYVEGHMRTNRDRSFWNNMSSYGNTNPYTGRTGTRLPPSSSN